MGRRRQHVLFLNTGNGMLVHPPATLLPHLFAHISSNCSCILYHPQALPSQITTPRHLTARVASAMPQPQQTTYPLHGFLNPPCKTLTRENPYPCLRGIPINIFRVEGPLPLSSILSTSSGASNVAPSHEQSIPSEVDLVEENEVSQILIMNETEPYIYAEHTDVVPAPDAADESLAALASLAPTPQPELTSKPELQEGNAEILRYTSIPGALHIQNTPPPQHATVPPTVAMEYSRDPQDHPFVPLI
ncbi:unnamed protein product [Cyclocybe aegerita]|uniref:Uncharacterized protein n=1 Tax=Cyclocybe aegerita TaxID=1973307 RepID=A0A8S0VRP4_CYCAE|nr:unnamed protein product [Cyclocybe aegerita]